MLSQKTLDLIGQYKASVDALYMLHNKISEAIDEDTDGRVGLCIMTKDYSPAKLHVYISALDGGDISEVVEIADNHELSVSYTYEDNTKIFDFTVNGTNCYTLFKKE